LSALGLVNAWLAGFFALAAVHYAFQWWSSRFERVLLLFSIQCAAYSAFSCAFLGLLQATTIHQAQSALDLVITLGMFAHALVLHFYASLTARRDHLFRALVTLICVGLMVLNQWMPLRGTVTALQSIALPGGGVFLIPVRTPPGAPLVLGYLALLAVNGYGFLVVGNLWRQDRLGAFFVALSSTAIIAGGTVGFLVDFAHLKAPYVGALPHAIFVLAMALFLSREYGARGAELRHHRDRLEELVATRTRELRQAKDDAEHASRTKSRFLANMSHEIRNPLHVVKLYAQLLEKDQTLDARQLKHIETMHRSVKHLSGLIDDVLEMSRLEAGRSALVEDRFDLSAMLAEVAQMFAAEAGSKGVALTLEPASDLPGSLVGDGGKVRQILINLTSNAVKFTNQGSIRVTATSRTVDTTILTEIIVADTGIGITEPERARLFKPFEQLDAGMKAGGTGLGLAISLSHARLMGGDLTVESTVGVGSRFTLTFVTKGVEAEAASQELQAPTQAEKLRKKVLIVDDMEIIRDAMAQLLAQLGVDSRTAEDGDTAVSIHDEWKPDVVLMDLRMPRMDGIEAIRRLRAGGSRAAIGALSGGAFGEDESAALGAGADFFLRKPFDAQELLGCVGRALEARSQE
jgi:signal transduction histidine kinase/ActR/RegA family two-component response regulator